MTAMAVETAAVNCTRMADGLLVQLAGEFSGDQVTQLRSALLSALPEECRDVIVDAGDVSDITVEALAVVFAGWAWAEERGARFLLSRTSREFDDALAANGVADDLPRLTALPSAPDAPVIPLQRVAVS